MPLQQTSGNVTSDAYGGGVAVEPVYIEQIFSTYLYTGNGSTQTITNGIDLAGKGGLVWIKGRTGASNNMLWDSVSTANLSSNTTDASGNSGTFITGTSSDGFSINNNSRVNQSTYNFASWTFRKQPKFFDVVTWSGTGMSVAHSLGTTPATIILKRTNAVDDWYVVHRSANGFFSLNTTNAASGTSNAGIGTDTNTAWVAATSTTCNFENFGNAAGTYVAYLFAHNAGGFGLTGTDNVISCGSFTTDGSGNATVTLGYEPQWVLYKRTSSAGNWLIVDNMRGDSANATNNANYLLANTSDAEGTATWFYPTATGFTGNANSIASTDFIYIAIRRGPMKVPTSGTSVFSAQTGTYSAGDSLSVGFPADMYIDAWRTGTLYKANYSRLVNFANSNSSASQNYLKTNTTDAEVTTSQAPSLYDLWNTTAKVGSWNAGVSEVWWMFRRAPSFFDEVCYTGNGSARTVTHNLGVAPELLIVKSRSQSGGSWNTWTTGFTISSSSNEYVTLNSTSAKQDKNTSEFWGSSYPTASVFGLGDNYYINNTGDTYVAYLFATCAGVSKVGSYTGNGTTQTINCGFTGGARFVLIKRTDSTGDWYVYDTARGMTVLTDPYLLLNSTSAESATLGSVTTVSTGFALNASILAAINTNAASYIFLAIA